MRRLEVLGFDARAVALRWFGRFLVVYRVHLPLVSAGYYALIAAMPTSKHQVHGAVEPGRLELELYLADCVEL